MISMLLPTHRRPGRLRETVNSIRATATNDYGGVEIVAAVDDDDLETILALTEMGIRYNTGPQITKEARWNKAAEIATGDILMMCADDVIFRTPGWNKMVEEAFAEYPDRILMVYGDDGHNGEKFSAFPAISRKWSEITGYFTHPAFAQEMTDLWLFDIAGMLGRRRYLPFVTDHMHWIWGKAEKDETYQKDEAVRKRDNPAALYRQLLPQRKADAEKLRAAMIQP